MTLQFQEEGTVLKEAVANFTSRTVVSLTGSNPMDMEVMKALQVIHTQFPPNSIYVCTIGLSF